MGSNRIKEENVRGNPSGYAPEMFDGSGSWEEFIFQFKWLCKLNPWTDVEKAGHLVELLRGQALSLICTLGDSVSTFDDMVSALEKRYACRGQEPNFMCLLRTRQQKPTESLTTFTVDLEILVRRALPGYSNEVLETVALQQFYDGIRDDRIREEVVASLSTSLCEALDVALQVEAKLIRVDMLHQILNKRLRTTSGRHQQRIPLSKWKCYKCGEMGHLRGNCPWRDGVPSKNNINLKPKCTIRSISLPDAVTVGTDYGMIARSKAPSAPDSVGVSSLEDCCSRIGNSGFWSSHEILRESDSGISSRPV